MRLKPSLITYRLQMASPSQVILEDAERTVWIRLRKTDKFIETAKTISEQKNLGKKVYNMKLVERIKKLSWGYNEYMCIRLLG